VRVNEGSIGGILGGIDRVYGGYVGVRKGVASWGPYIAVAAVRTAVLRLVLFISGAHNDRGAAREALWGGRLLRGGRQGVKL
jgi:hypothetical protein